MRTDTGQVFRLEDYRPSDYLIPQTDIVFRLDPDKTLVRTHLVVQRREGIPVDTPLVLDGDGLTLVSVSIDDRPVAPASMDTTPDRLELRDLPATGKFTVSIETEISPSTNTALMGLYRSTGGYCTQCEAEGFRRITYFLDRPDVLSVYSVRIEAKKAEVPLLLSNGNPGKTGDLPGGFHFAEWHDPHPKPSYLFALVAGDLGKITDSFTTASGRHVDLAIYVEHGNEGRAYYAMDALKRSMRWDEQVFGLEYDLDVFNIVAVSDFNMGAMENKGLNVFNEKYVLADPETATDVDYANIEAVIAHEYFHNWTGNRITCRDWFQLCLKEGLTVFRDHEFSADQRSRPVRRIAEVRTLKAHQFPEDQGPLAHPVRPRRYREINNFYTATVYEKGSEVVRMIRTILGTDLFRAGMDLYLKRHDGDAATIEDFLKAFEDASGRDLSQFALWYHQAGTPSVSVSTRHEPGQDRFVVELEQTLAPAPGERRPKLMHIPLAFGLVGTDGQDLAPKVVHGAQVEGGVIHLQKRRHTVVFEEISERPVLSLNRGFSAPVNLVAEERPEDRLFLARYDSDLFSRWQAANALLTGALIAATAKLREGKRPVFDPAIPAMMGELVADDRLEPAFRAMAITLPGEADIAREIGNDIDPDAVHDARDALVRRIAEANRTTLGRIREAMAERGAFAVDAASAGRRALGNAILDYQSVEGPGPAAEHYRSATNMTDRAAALTVLVHRHASGPEAAEALADFADRFGNDGLVMDKWLAIQASAPGPAALDSVRGLMGHPVFVLSNPNRVRSLVGTFGAGNQTGFHRPDGEGYRFYADTVLAVERLNPQVAARLATAFRSWRSLEAVRREKARSVLELMAGTEGLSPDLRDIVERTLA